MSLKPKKAGVFFILVTILLDCIGFGIIIPIMPSLIIELTGTDVSGASEYGGLMLTLYSLMMFLCAPILGGLSDQWGRRTVLLISIMGMAIDYLFLAFAHTISLLFLARFIAGICGASITTASAYIADVSKPEERAQNFGLIGAAFGLGFIIGPVIGGIFSQFGTRVPFLIAAGLSLANWIYGYFVLPESLKPENRRKFEWKRANPIGAFMQLKRYPSLIGLLIALLILFTAAQSTQTVWAYFTQELFSWNERQIGYSLGFVGLTVAIVQGGLIRFIIPRLGHKRSIMLGLLLYILGFTLFAFATEGWMMYLFMLPYGLAGITNPAIQGIISTQVKPNEQGELQGIMTSLMSVSSIIGPLMMSYLFAQFTHGENSIYFPGAPFLMGAILTCIAAFICYKNLKRHH